MSTEAHSVKAKVASDGPREAPVAPEQSTAQSSSGAEHIEALFKKAFEEAENMTPEERQERSPFLKNMTAVPVTVDKGMQILEEMERVEREEAARADGTETTAANNAS